MQDSNPALILAADVLRGMAHAAKGESPEAVAAALRKHGRDFAFAISGTKMARKAAAAKKAARGTGRIVVPVSHKTAGRPATIR